MKNLNTLINLEFMYNTVLNETKFSQLGKRFFDAVNAKLTTGLIVRWYKDNSSVFTVTFHDQSLRTELNYHTEVAQFCASDKVSFLEKIQNHLSEIKQQITAIEEQTANTDKILAMEERAKTIFHNIYLEVEQFTKEYNTLMGNKALQIDLDTTAIDMLYDFKVKSLPTIQKLFKTKLCLIALCTVNNETNIVSKEFIVYPTEQNQTIEDYKKELQTTDNEVKIYIGTQKRYSATFKNVENKHLQYREGVRHYHAELHDLITKDIEKRYSKFFNANDCTVQWENN